MSTLHGHPQEAEEVVSFPQGENGTVGVSHSSEEELR